MQDKQEQILSLINQLIDIFYQRDTEKILNRELDGDTWEIHNLKLLKLLIEDYFKNEK